MPTDMESPTVSSTVISLLENYGWYILISAVLIAYILNLFQPKISKYLEWRNEQEYAAKYHKNPDLLTRRLIVQNERVAFLQGQHEKDAEAYQQKLKEREAKKLEETKQKYEKMDLGEKLGSGSSGASKSLKPEYNPLMGDNSRSYRPTRKSPCSGGGCGK